MRLSFRTERIERKKVFITNFWISWFATRIFVFAQGAHGSRGPMGDPGPQGDNGRRGRDGMKGIKGRKGAQVK